MFSSSAVVEEDPYHQMGQLGEGEAEQLDRDMWAPEEDDDQVGYTVFFE